MLTPTASATVANVGRFEVARRLVTDRILLTVAVSAWLGAQRRIEQPGQDSPSSHPFGFGRGVDASTRRQSADRLTAPAYDHGPLRVDQWPTVHRRNCAARCIRPENTQRDEVGP
jgi:hypothetical protein